MSVHGRVYNLASKKPSNIIYALDSSELKNLSVIAEEPEIISNGNNERDNLCSNVINIFNETADSERIENIRDLHKVKSYELLCLKEIKGYLSKMKPHKNAHYYHSMRSKVSVSVLSKQSNICRSVNSSNEYLTYDELMQGIQQKQTMKKLDESKLPLPVERYSNVRSIKKKHEDYMRNWQNWRTKSHRTRKVEKLLVNFKNIRKDDKDIQKHRAKMEKLERYGLTERKQNISPRDWQNNLRNQANFQDALRSSYVEKIERGSLKVKGNNKEKSEMSWLESKKKALFRKNQFPQPNNKQGTPQSTTHINNQSTKQKQSRLSQTISH